MTKDVVHYPTIDGRLARGQARRQLILDAGVGVVASVGAAGLTHRAVADAARVSLASVTYHFPTADDLRTSTFEHAGGRVGMAFRELMLSGSVSTQDIPEVLGGYVAGLVVERRDELQAVFELIVAAAHSDVLRPMVVLLNARLATLLQPYTGDRQLAFALTAALQGLALSALARRPTTMPDEAFGVTVADLVRRYRMSSEPYCDNPAEAVT